MHFGFPWNKFRQDAAETFSLPEDRIGDIVVLAEEGTALGRYAEWHDLTGLDAPLRSHGALGEVQIPFLINRVLPRPDLERWMSWPCCCSADAFGAVVGRAVTAELSCEKSSPGDRRT